MQLLTLPEAAQQARISSRLLRQQILNGEGPQVTRLGSGRGRILIRRECLEAWIIAKTTTSIAA
jgi:hypothetical protein